MSRKRVGPRSRGADTLGRFWPDHLIVPHQSVQLGAHQRHLRAYALGPRIEIPLHGDLLAEFLADGSRDAFRPIPRSMRALSSGSEPSGEPHRAPDESVDETALARLAGALPAHGLTSRTCCGRGYLLGASAGGRENVCLTIPRGAACGRRRFRPCRARRPESRGEMWTVTGGKVVDAGRRKRLRLTSTERQASIKPAPEPKHVEFRAPIWSPAS